MSVDIEGQETYDTLNCEGEKNSLENDQKKSVNASLFCTRSFLCFHHGLT